MQENNRKRDSAIEREMARFIDEHVYSDKSMFETFTRTDDIESQVGGCDVILTPTNEHKKRFLSDELIVDEKVASRYANTPIGTFSLELSFKNKRGEVVDGWFLKDGLDTTAYLLGWVDEADIPLLFDDGKRRKYDVEKLTKDSVRSFEWCLVEKSDVKDWLGIRGWTEDRLREQENAIRSRGFVRDKSFIDGIAFRFSDRYVEEPINILLKRETYRDIARMKGVVEIVKKS